MYGSPKSPADKFPYSRSVESCPLSGMTPVGKYVFVVDVADMIHVVPDGAHRHPVVLGNAEPALYAGEISIDVPGSVDEVTNLSGTFRFKSQKSLCCVASGLRQLGFSVGDVVWYPPNGSSPVILACV
jgi:hypothetical protein